MTVFLEQFRGWVIQGVYILSPHLFPNDTIVVTSSTTVKYLRIFETYNRSRDLYKNGKFQKPLLLPKSSFKLILTFILGAHWPPFFVTYWLFHKHSSPYFFFLKMAHSILEIPLGIHNFSLWRLTNLELYQKIPSLSPCQKYLSMLKITFNPSLKKRKFRSCRGVWGLVRTPFLLKILSFSPLTTPGRGLILLLDTWNSEVHLVV